MSSATAVKTVLNKIGWLTSFRSLTEPAACFTITRAISTANGLHNEKTKLGSSNLEDENDGRVPTMKHKPTAWEKRMLVWTKRYPAVDQVPDYVSADTMQKSKNKARIYINIGMGILTLMACIAMIRSGRKAAQKGENVQQMNLDWHKKENQK